MGDQIQSQSGGRCTIDIRVRYAECDAMGYLHHGRYWEYFELVRTELLKQHGVRYRDLEASGIYFVVYKCSCRYLLPIRYDDLVCVTAEVVRTTRTRVDHTYHMVVDGRRTTEATTTLACVGRDGKPTLMSDELWSFNTSPSRLE